MTKPVRSFLLLFCIILALVFLFIWINASTFFNIHLLDFEHYLSGSRMVWNGTNPYGVVEYFAPPWMAILIGPFLFLSVHSASILWLLFNFISIFITIIVSLQWVVPIKKMVLRIPAILGFSLMPASLFCFISGQVSPVVGLSLLLFAWYIVTQRKNPWILIVSVIVVSLKPNIVLIPVLLCLLELVFRRNWRNLAYISFSLLAAIVFAFITNPNWVADLYLAWRTGNYLGGKPGLVASGYMGLGDLGVPVWIFLPLVAYLVYYWKKEGLTNITIALAIAINFLIVPYSRRYDYVLFILPGCFLINEFTWRKWLPITIAMVSLLVIPFTNLFLLTPLLMTIGILLKVPGQIDGKVSNVEKENNGGT